MNTQRSASPSCAIPRSAPSSTTILLSSDRLSSVGSLGCPGNSPWGLPLTVIALTPSFLISRGVVMTEAPLAQSTHTVSPAFLIRSASTLETIESTYSSPASDTETVPPIMFHGAQGISDAYAFSMADSSSWLHSVPSPDMHLIPLNSGGLCEAVIMTPPLTSGLHLT